MYHRCYQDAIVTVINDRQGDLRILIDLAYLQWQRVEFPGLLVFFQNVLRESSFDIVNSEKERDNSEICNFELILCNSNNFLFLNNFLRFSEIIVKLLQILVVCIFTLIFSWNISQLKLTFFDTTGLIYFFQNTPTFPVMIFLCFLECNTKHLSFLIQISHCISKWNCFSSLPER